MDRLLIQRDKSVSLNWRIDENILYPSAIIRFIYYSTRFEENRGQRSALSLNLNKLHFKQQNFNRIFSLKSKTFGYRHYSNGRLMTANERILCLFENAPFVEPDNCSLYFIDFSWFVLDELKLTVIQ